MNIFLLHSGNGQHLSVSAKKPPSENKASANSPDMAIHTNFPKTMGEIQKASRDQLTHWYRCKPVGTTAAEKKVCDRVAKRWKKLGGTPQQAGKVQWPSRTMAVASFSDIGSEVVVAAHWRSRPKATSK
jgi:hypothetical protein